MLSIHHYSGPLLLIWGLFRQNYEPDTILKCQFSVSPPLSPRTFLILHFKLLQRLILICQRKEWRGKTIVTATNLLRIFSRESAALLSGSSCPTILATMEFCRSLFRITVVWGTTLQDKNQNMECKRSNLTNKALTQAYGLKSRLKTRGCLQALPSQHCAAVTKAEVDNPSNLTSGLLQALKCFHMTDGFNGIKSMTPGKVIKNSSTQDTQEEVCKSQLQRVTKFLFWKVWEQAFSYILQLTNMVTSIRVIPREET